MLSINAQRFNEQKLGRAQAKWKAQCYEKVLEGNEGIISCPFRFGVPVDFIESKKTVMLVGQEARGLTCDYETWDSLSKQESIDDDGEIVSTCDYAKWSIPRMQKWVIEYTERQLGIGEHKEIAFNGSPFWRFARALKANGYFPCWNNLEKITQYNGATEHRLKCDDEGYAWRRILNEKVSPFDQSLLQREIELTKPDIVVFVIGPKDPYWSSLAYAFDIDKYIIADHRPTPDMPCVDITNCLGLNMPRTYWTFHPQFLSRNGLFKRVIEEITQS